MLRHSSWQADWVRLVQVRFLGIESIDLASYHIYPSPGPYESTVTKAQVSSPRPGFSGGHAALLPACMTWVDTGIQKPCTRDVVRQAVSQ